MKILRKVIPVLFFKLGMAVTCWPDKSQAQGDTGCFSDSGWWRAVNSSAFPGFFRGKLVWSKLGAHSTASLLYLSL